MKDEAENLSPALRALADPTRLKILLMLEGRSRTVGEFVDFFELTQPAISRHLQTLTSAGLVDRRREGQRVYYALNIDRVRELCIQLTACFPCCCITVAPLAGSRAGKLEKAKTKSTKRRRKPSTHAKEKGVGP
jgi:ArsR family transcriptional regulator